MQIDETSYDLNLLKKDSCADVHRSFSVLQIIAFRLF